MQVMNYCKVPHATSSSVTTAIPALGASLIRAPSGRKGPPGSPSDGVNRGDQRALSCGNSHYCLNLNVHAGVCLRQYGRRFGPAILVFPGLEAGSAGRAEQWPQHVQQVDLQRHLCADERTDGASDIWLDFFEIKSDHPLV